MKYPNKKSKGAAIKSWDKLSPDDDLFKQMMLALDSQIRWRKRAAKTGNHEFIANWAHPATWINQQKWLDEHPTSFSDLVEISSIKECGCGKPSTHRGKMNLWYCAKCWMEKYQDTWLAKMRKRIIYDIGLTPKSNRNECMTVIKRRHPAISTLIGNK